MPPKKMIKCGKCQNLVRCSAETPWKSMAMHQNLPVCYEVPYQMPLKIGNRAVKGNESETNVIVEPEGQMDMQTHILPIGIPILPLPEFLEEYVFNDRESSKQDEISPPDAMDITSERGTHRMFGRSLLLLDDDENLVYKDQNDPQPSFEPLKFQNKLEEKYFDELQRKRNVRNQRRSTSELEAQVGLKPVDSIVLDLLYIHSIKKKFTTSDVDKCLSLIDDITKISFNSTVNKTQWRSMKKYYDKFIGIFSPLIRLEYALPPEMFLEVNEGNPLRPYYGVMVHVMEEIGFELLKVKRVKETFVFEHELMKNSNGDHLTSLVYFLLYKMVFLKTNYLMDDCLTI